MITYLNQNDYKNKNFEYSYISPGQLIANIEYHPQFKCEFIEHRFEIPLEMRIASTFFPDHFSDVVVMVMYHGSHFCAVLQYAYEDWTHRLRICDYYVDPHFRGKGYGTLLMNQVKKDAKDKKVRQIILEVSSYNLRAILFYQTHGFHIEGFDLSHYLKKHSKPKEFRIEMVYNL